MARCNRIYSSELPIHITARTNNKDPFCLNQNFCWDLYKQYLKQGYKEFKIQIHAFVLMNNHFHLLISTPLDNQGQFMMWFMRETAKKINYHSKRINHLYGGRYHSQVIENCYYYAIVLKYIFRNPVKAQLSDAVENYKFSTIHEGQNKKNDSITTVKPLNGIDCLVDANIEANLEFWNTPFENEDEPLIQNGLKKSKFEISWGTTTQAKIYQELRRITVKTINIEVR